MTQLHSFQVWGWLVDQQIIKLTHEGPLKGTEVNHITAPYAWMYQDGLSVEEAVAEALKGRGTEAKSPSTTVVRAVEKAYTEMMREIDYAVMADERPEVIEEATRLLITKLAEHTRSLRVWRENDK